MCQGKHVQHPVLLAMLSVTSPEAAIGLLQQCVSVYRFACNVDGVRAPC